MARPRLLPLLAGLLALSPLVAAAERPNILLIVADDLGWSDVGWHGGFAKTHWKSLKALVNCAF